MSMFLGTADTMLLYVCGSCSLNYNLKFGLSYVIKDLFPHCFRFNHLLQIFDHLFKFASSYPDTKIKIEK